MNSSKNTRKLSSLTGKIQLPTMDNPYEGVYDITPSVDGGELPTLGKTMMDNVTVNPIPYSEVPNSGGGNTINIAYD